MGNPFKWLKRKEQQAQMSLALSVVRHSLTTVGGGLVTHGYLDHNQLEGLVGAFMTMVAICWSAFVKWDKSRNEISND
jgi:hypothetical protein